MSFFKEARNYADSLLLKLSKKDNAIGRRIRGQIKDNNDNNEKGGKDTMKKVPEIVSETEEESAEEPEQINSDEDIEEKDIKKAEGEKKVQNEPKILEVPVFLTQNDINAKVIELESVVNNLIKALQGDKK